LFKNRFETEKFWSKYISSEGRLEEIRWDLFEDGLLSWLHDQIYIDPDILP
jgi:hypothetical protein